MMRCLFAILGLSTLSGNLGCSEGPSPTAIPLDAATDNTEAPIVDASILPGRKPPDPVMKALKAAQQMSRKIAYEREGRIELPRLFPKAMGRALGSTSGRKLVRVQASQNMRASAPTTGLSRFEIRWVTLRSAKTLTDALKASLVAAGWKPSGANLPRRFKAQDGTLLSWKIEEPLEEPSVVDLVMEIPGKSINTAIISELKAENAFTKWAKNISFSGYEYGLFHATRPGSSYSDLERLAITIGPEKAKTAGSILRDTTVRSGFKADATDGRLLKGPNRTTLTTRTRSDGTIVIHYQRRWQRNQAARPGSYPSTEKDPPRGRNRK